MKISISGGIFKITNGMTQATKYENGNLVAELNINPGEKEHGLWDNAFTSQQEQENKGHAHCAGQTSPLKCRWQQIGFKIYIPSNLRLCGPK